MSHSVCADTSFMIRQYLNAMHRRVFLRRYVACNGGWCGNVASQPDERKYIPIMIWR